MRDRHTMGSNRSTFAITLKISGALDLFDNSMTMLLLNTRQMLSRAFCGHIHHHSYNVKEHESLSLDFLRHPLSEHPPEIRRRNLYGLKAAFCEILQCFSMAPEKVRRVISFNHLDEVVWWSWRKSSVER